MALAFMFRIGATRRLLPARYAPRRGRRGSVHRLRADGDGGGTAVTLKIYDVEQGSQEWHDVRRGIVTASVMGKLITPKTIKPADNDYSRDLTRIIAAERLTGFTEPTFISADMWRGIDDEPRARAKYAEHYAPVTEVGFIVEEMCGVRIGYSPDGLVGDDGLIEIKSRRAKAQLATILADEVPLENMAQLQCGLLVSGRDWIDYVSFCSGMPLFVKRVYPQRDWFEAIRDATQALEERVSEIILLYNAAVVGLHMTERIVETEIVL